MRTIALLFVLMPLCAWGQQPEYIRFFDPAKGFKPAQINLTDIFLQLAGSLECYGSPEPYMRHIQAEHERIAKEYSAKTGKESRSHLPAYMTDAYIDQGISNWKIMAPKLHLENLARDAGLCAREAIRGTRDSGTMLVGIFNRHQDLVAKGMEGGSPKAGFEQLKATLTTELEFDKPEVKMQGYEVARRDAVSYALVFDGRLSKLYKGLDGQLAPEKASKIEAAITDVFLDLGQMAQSELELGILEASIR